MQKQAPSLGRILAMVIFAMSCFGLLLYLWLAFGGPVPLKPQSYRLEAAFPEAATLAQEADVRIAGVTVGRVKTKELNDEDGTIHPSTLVELEIQDEYAPVPANTRAILRQKTLLGETYVELTPGTSGEDLEDGGRLPDAQVEPTVELDEIYQAFDRPTREAFRAWIKNSAGAIRGGTGQHLNDAIGNLEGFAVDGADILEVLDEQGQGLRQLVKNTGVTFKALNERTNGLRDLIVNSNNVFEATASRDDALAETFAIFPTFLDESKVTLARLQAFATDTRPLVRDLRPVADDLGPTVRDLGDLAPDLEQLFEDLDPLIDAANEHLPEAVRFLDCARDGENCPMGEGAPGLFEGLNVFLEELNPFLAYVNYMQEPLAVFISSGSATLNGTYSGVSGKGHLLPQYGVNNSRSLGIQTSRPNYERGNAYGAPNYLNRAFAFGGVESFGDCQNAGGEIEDPQPGGAPGVATEMPPCFVAPPSLYSGTTFPRVQSGDDDLREKPSPTGGSQPLPNLDDGAYPGTSYDANGDPARR
ncbi:MAG TPA: MlaD family protein [Thermoleophilaceae bacterium]|nr:MlaD family protein [Thermoleophilaceae bacterium]